MLTAEALHVYRTMLSEPTLGVAALSARVGLEEEAVREALDLLADEALLQPDSGSGSLTTTHPRVALARLIERAEAEQAARQVQVNAMRATLEAIAADHESGLGSERVVIHDNPTSIRSRLEQLALGARHECVSLNPGREHKPEDMAASKPLNQLALERGVAIRCVYQDSFRHDPGTLDYARWLTGLGGEVRTVPLVGDLMVIVDAEVALLPRTPGCPADGALEVHAPGIVAALLAMFETKWSIAAPFGTVPTRADDDVPAMTKEVLGLLATGITDEAVANRLGLSARTVRRIVSGVMAEVGAQSRFQVGVEAARRGWISP